MANTTAFQCQVCSEVFAKVVWAEQHSIDTDGLHVDFDAVTTAGTGSSAPGEQVVTRDQTGINPFTDEPRRATASGLTEPKPQEQHLRRDHEIRERLKQMKLQEVKAQREERDRIRRLIEQDKERRRVEREERTRGRGSPDPLPVDAQPVTIAPTSASAGLGDRGGDKTVSLERTRLRLRMLDTGETWDKAFSLDAKLSDVAEALQNEMNLPGGVESFTLQAGLPRKVWKEDEFASVTLGDAGLGKSAALMVKRKPSSS